MARVGMRVVVPPSDLVNAATLERRALAAELKYVRTARADTPVPREWLRAPAIFRYRGRRPTFFPRDLRTTIDGSSPGRGGTLREAHTIIS